MAVHEHARAGEGIVTLPLVRRKCSLDMDCRRAAGFENLESGATVDQFLECFPGVKREDALAVLETAAKD